MIAALIAKLRSLADRDLPQRLQDGRRGEELAYRHLRREGYRVVARNYRSRSGKGEIDLLGWDGEMLACVEVKTRKNADFGRPEEFGATCAFIASAHAGYMTGQNILLDGGSYPGTL